MSVLRLCVVSVVYDVLATGETRRRFVSVIAANPSEAVRMAEREVEWNLYPTALDGAPADVLTEDGRLQVKRVSGSLHTSYPLDLLADEWPSV